MELCGEAADNLSFVGVDHGMCRVQLRVLWADHWKREQSRVYWRCRPFKVCEGRDKQLWV